MASCLSCVWSYPISLSNLFGNIFGGTQNIWELIAKRIKIISYHPHKVTTERFVKRDILGPVTSEKNRHPDPSLNYEVLWIDLVDTSLHWGCLTTLFFILKYVWRWYLQWLVLRGYTVLVILPVLIVHHKCSSLCGFGVSALKLVCLGYWMSKACKLNGLDHRISDMPFTLSASLLREWAYSRFLAASFSTNEVLAKERWQAGKLHSTQGNIS